VPEQPAPASPPLRNLRQRQPVNYVNHTIFTDDDTQAPSPSPEDAQDPVFDPQAAARAATEARFEALRQARAAEDEVAREARLAANRERDRHRRAQPPPTIRTFRVPAGGSLRDIQRHDLGRMQHVCRHCNALHWEAESTGAEGYSMCCSKGKVQLPGWAEPPLVLKRLYEDNTPEGREFRKNLRAYNSCLQFASSSAKVSRQVLYGAGAVPVLGGVHQFGINGAVHHITGPILPDDGEPPKFAQLYILDPEQAQQARAGIFTHLNARTLRKLQEMMLAVNPVAALYQTPDIRSMADVRAVIVSDNRTLDRRVYNANVVPEIAGLMPDGENAQAKHREIVLTLRGGGLQRISEQHSAYDP